MLPISALCFTQLSVIYKAVLKESLTSWLELGPVAIRASKWSLWIRAHMETVSVGADAGGGAPHNGWMKPLNCSATSISVVGLRMMVVLRRMDTWQRSDGG